MIPWLKKAWNAWADLWNLTEGPQILGLFRLLFGATLVYDYGLIGKLGLVQTLYAPVSGGGIAEWTSGGPDVYAILPAEPWVAQAWWALLLTSSVGISLGAFTRTCAGVNLLLSAQFAMMLGPADRGIDLLIRNLLTLLVFTQSARWLSVDAWVTTGSIWGDGLKIPAWPRHLIVLQVVVMYFDAGVQKGGVSWLPLGHFTALYIILQDWAVTRMPGTWAAGQPWFILTQIASAGTLVWEWTAPLVILSFWFRYTRERGGKIRNFFVKYRFHLLWLSAGLPFHGLIHIWLDLGIFPWTMLTTYLCFVHPDELLAVWYGLRDRLVGPRAAPVAAP